MKFPWVVLLSTITGGVLGALLGIAPIIAAIKWPLSFALFFVLGWLTNRMGSK